MATNISKITINVPIQKVWDILTKPELVKLWQYGSELITEWNVGGNIKFRAEWEGQLFEQWGKVLEMRANQLIKYNLFASRPDLEDKPENYFIMSYVLNAENGQPKLEIIQEDNRPGEVQEEPQADENETLQSLKKIAQN